MINHFAGRSFTAWNPHLWLFNRRPQRNRINFYWDVLGKILLSARCWFSNVLPRIEIPGYFSTGIFRSPIALRCPLSGKGIRGPDGLFLHNNVINIFVLVFDHFHLPLRIYFDIPHEGNALNSPLLGKGAIGYWCVDALDFGFLWFYFFDHLQFLIHEWVFLWCFFVLLFGIGVIEQGGGWDMDGEIVVYPGIYFLLHFWEI